jgi:predicted secreted protein
MATSTLVAIYFIIWWVVLFAILPWGVHSQAESGDVAPRPDPGAPSVPRGRRKLLWTTVTAAVVFGIAAAVYKAGLIPLEFLKQISNPPHS